MDNQIEIDAHSIGNLKAIDYCHCARKTSLPSIIPSTQEWTLAPVVLREVLSETRCPFLSLSTSVVLRCQKLLLPGVRLTVRFLSARLQVFYREGAGRGRVV